MRNITIEPKYNITLYDFSNSEIERVCCICVYFYHIIITFCYKIKKIQEKKLFKLVIVQEFDWLSRHV